MNKKEAANGTLQSVVNAKVANQIVFTIGPTMGRKSSSIPLLFTFSKMSKHGHGNLSDGILIAL